MAEQTIQCTTACTVTLVLEPSPVNTEHLQDIALAFGLMFLATILIWGGREVLKVFSTGPHDGS